MVVKKQGNSKKDKKERHKQFEMVVKKILYQKSKTGTYNIQTNDKNTLLQASVTRDNKEMSENVKLE